MARLLNRSGRFGFILPHKFFNAKYGEPIRQIVACGNHLGQIVHFGHQQIFEGATTYTCLLFLDKAANKEFAFLTVNNLHEWRKSGWAMEGKLPTTQVTSSEWNFIIGSGQALIEKLSENTTTLEHVADRIFQGIKTSADKIYIVNELERDQTRSRVYSPQLDAEFWLERELLHPLVKGGDSRRYCLSQTERRILFPYASNSGNAALIGVDKLKTEFPLTWDYLLKNKEYLENREGGKMRGRHWYAYGRNQALDVMPLSKIFTPDIALRASYSLDTSGESFFTGGVAGGYGILVNKEWSRSYILGLLNSTLLNWYIRMTATQMRGGYFSFESRFIRHLPIGLIDSTDKSQVERQGRVIALVEQMITLHKRLAAAKTPHETKSLETQIAATDRQIDNLVYELYGLTPEEIQIVESAGREPSGAPEEPIAEVAAGG